jgi:hypothetical protein
MEIHVKKLQKIQAIKENLEKNPWRFFIRWLWPRFEPLACNSTAAILTLCMI